MFTNLKNLYENSINFFYQYYTSVGWFNLSWLSR